MNILMALSQLEVTGAEVYAITLSNELIKRKNKVFIVSDTLTKKTPAEYFEIQFNKRSLFQRLGHVRKLLKIIKENDIQVVHAHSRASAWSSALACKIAGIPLITTTHGKQPVHLSRKLIKCFGDYGIAVCENIKHQLITELGVDNSKIEVLRNPVDCNEYLFQAEEKEDERIVVSIIGRLSGPKGDVCYDILDEISDRKDLVIRVIGGKVVPKRFEKFKNKVEFMGYINNVYEEICKSSIVIGAGRVAVEAILSGKPVIAVGENEYLGSIGTSNIDYGLKSNFGDINLNENLDSKVEIRGISQDINNAIKKSHGNLLELRKKVEKNFSLEKIVDRIEEIYSKQYVLKNKYEIPIIMYHRVIKGNDEEKGVHGTYIEEKIFRQHMEYLKDKGYETVTFEDLKDNNYKKRFDKDKKLIILTFDDGYKDNYEIAFPILKEFGFKAVIYLLGNLKYNKWDAENNFNPEKVFHLMSDEEILEMQDYGIEFGGHSMTHSKMGNLNPEIAKKEIIDSKEILEKKLGKKLTSFAYPYGHRSKLVRKFVKEAGYEFAVTTDNGDVSFQEDLFDIRRIAIFPTNGKFSFKRKVTGKYNFIKIKREEKHMNK